MIAALYHTHCILCDAVLAPPRKRPGWAPFFPCCASRPFWYLMFLVRGPPPCRRVGGRNLTCHAPRSSAVCWWCVGARHDRDPESDQNAWICLSHETVILEVVGRPMNPTLRCKDIKWSDNNLLRSVILTIQLYYCMVKHTCNRP